MLTYVYDGVWKDSSPPCMRVCSAGKKWRRLPRTAGIHPRFFSTAKVIATDPEKARKLRRFLRKRLSRQAFQNLVYCYLSESGMEKTILSYIKLLVSPGRKTGGNSPAPTRDIMATIDAITETAKKVAYEVHRFHGFLRFRRVYGDLYYAPIEPDHNIIALLIPHFTRQVCRAEVVHP